VVLLGAVLVPLVLGLVAEGWSVVPLLPALVEAPVSPLEPGVRRSFFLSEVVVVSAVGAEVWSVELVAEGSLGLAGAVDPVA
jgi:hypothetical protein